MQRIEKRMKQWLKATGLALTGIFLASCSTMSDGLFEDDPRLQRDIDDEPTFVSESGFSYWDDKPGDGPLKVTVDLSDQAAYFDRGTVRVGRSRIASGRAGHRTPTGSYSVMEKKVDKRSNLYGRILGSDGRVLISDADTRKHDVPEGGRYLGAAMPYWMRLTSSGIGMHVGPIPNPGRPASHGCIRMPRQMAQLMFANVRVGTPVTVVR